LFFVQNGIGENWREFNKFLKNEETDTDAFASV